MNPYFPLGSHVSGWSVPLEGGTARGLVKGFILAYTGRTAIVVRSYQYLFPSGKRLEVYVDSLTREPQASLAGRIEVNAVRRQVIRELGNEVVGLTAFDLRGTQAPGIIVSVYPSVARIHTIGGVRQEIDLSRIEIVDEQDPRVLSHIAELDSIRMEIRTAAETEVREV